MRNLSLWSAASARNVETEPTPTVNVLRGLVARATTPLLPDDYLKLLDPLWSARERRGLVVDVRKGITDAATVTIKPGWGFSGDYQAGQYGIQMPLGCRMGICQSCVLPMESGYVRDLRSGTGHRAGDRIQTCISAASGDCTIDI
jgi:hypothetical protein